MQYDACKEYIMRSFPDPENIMFYEDDGYVRSNIDRPGMNQMKEDIADGLIDCVVIYRIDRITFFLAKTVIITKGYKSFIIRINSHS
jgi:DNA invertase Pin-like site-specific DNA recombinase